jgi:hypothetical protein
MFSLRKEKKTCEKDFTKLISNEELRFHTKTLYGYRVQLSRVKDQCITKVAHPYSQKTKLL